MSTPPEKLKSNKELGFTIVETLVALVVLSMAIIPALYLSTKAVDISEEIRDDLVAAGLAQEGIEVVRAIRDTNWFTGLAFDNSLPDGAYRLQWNSTSLLPLSGNPILLVSNGVYSYDSGANTKFRRTVTITKVNAGELKIVSQVTWPSKTNPNNSIQTEDHLFNWK